jgi:hypothetical protein
VRARLVARAEDWPWSSVRAHIIGADDGLVTVHPVLDHIPHFAELLSTTEDQDFGDLRLAEGSGRPLGMADFVIDLERLLGSPRTAEVAANRYHVDAFRSLTPRFLSPRQERLRKLLIECRDPLKPQERA